LNSDRTIYFPEIKEEAASIRDILPHEAVIWKVSIDHFHSLYPTFKAVLSAEEIARAQRFHQKNDVRRFITATIALRLLLSSYLNIHAADIRFLRGRYGKPYLANNPLSIHFNLSHSGNIILISFSLMPIGVDIEEMNPSFDVTFPMVDMFNEEEKAYLYQDRRDIVKRFYLLWTRKECLLKQNGTGIHETMSTYFVITNKPINTTTGISGNTTPVEVRSFLLPKHPNYMASICYDYRIRSLHYHTVTLDMSMFKTKA